MEAEFAAVRDLKIETDIDKMGELKARK